MVARPAEVNLVLACSQRQVGKAELFSLSNIKKYIVSVLDKQAICL